MKTIKQLSEEYARKAYFASGVNPNLVECVVYEALTEFKNLQQPVVIKSVCVHCGKGKDLHTVYSLMCPDRMHHFEQTVL